MAPATRPNQISQWKQQLLTTADELFKERSDQKKEQQAILIEELCKKIGQYQMELDWLKKNLAMSVLEKRALIEVHPHISLTRQCELLGLTRSAYYYQPAGESDFNLELMGQMDEQYMRTPHYGVGMMYGYLRRRLGYPVNIKRVRRLYRKMGLVDTTRKLSPLSQILVDLMLSIKYIPICCVT